MKISELIEELNRNLNFWGDLDVDFQFSNIDGESPSELDCKLSQIKINKGYKTFDFIIKAMTQEERFSQPKWTIK